MSDQLTMSVGPVVWVGPYPKGGTHPTGTHPAALWATTRTTQKHPGGSRPPGTHLNTTEETTAP